MGADELLRILRRWWGLVLVAALLVAGVHLYDAWWDEQNAEAAELRDKHLEAAQRARQAFDSLKLIRTRTDAAISEAREQARRADSLEAIAAAERARERDRAVETGETTLEAVEAAEEAIPAAYHVFLDTIQVRLERHLAADRRATEATDRQIARLRDARIAVEAENEQLRIRLAATDTALSSCRRRADACTAEAEHLRRMTKTSILGHIFSPRTLLELALLGIAAASL